MKGYQTHLACDIQHGGVSNAQQFRGKVQPVVVQVGGKALAGHFFEPAHKMALAAPAGFGGVLNPQRGSIFRFDQLQDRFQAAGVSSIRREQGAVLANQDGQKPQQRPFDGQLIPGVFYLVGFLRFLQELMFLSYILIKQTKKFTEIGRAHV